MKTRIKIDTAILCSIIIFTGLVYRFSKAYMSNAYLDGILDAEGFFIIFLGVYLRMVARGYKKAHSQSGHGLVLCGPYQLVRNPMYLGSFLLGAGFILILWPWWSLPIFAYIFYLRFKRQIIREETYLQSAFGQSYEDYLKQVPRLFPNFKRIKNMKFQEVFPREMSWSTKEKWGIIGWPLFALLLNIFQESATQNYCNVAGIILIFTLSVIIFFLMLGVLYKYE